MEYKKAPPARDALLKKPFNHCNDYYGRLNCYTRYILAKNCKKSTLNIYMNSLTL